MNGRLQRAAPAPWVLMLLGFTFLCGFFHVSDPDIGFHVRTGELVLREGRIPTRNTFSFACPDEPWRLHQWAPGVLLYGIDRLAGVPGVIVFKATMAALIFGVLWLAARRETDAGSPWPFWAATAGVMLARVRFFERPYMLSALLLALLVLLDRRHGRRRAWLYAGLPALMAVWANVHLGFVDGLVYLAALCAAAWLTWAGAAWAARRGAGGAPPAPPWARTLSTGLAAVAAVAALAVVNPNAWPILAYPLRYFGDPFWRDFILEFRPPGPALKAMLAASLAVIALLAPAASRPHGASGPERLLPVAVFAGLAWHTQRLVLSYAVVMVPILAELLHAALDRRWRVPRRPALLLLAPAWLGLLFFVVRPDPVLKFGIGLSPTLYPRGVFRCLEREVPSQNMYNDMLHGGAILWRLYPKFRPFVDGRCEAYSDDFWRRVYEPLSTGGRPWKEDFERYGISAALLYSPPDRPLRPLVRALRDDPAWALVAFDDTTLLFLQRSPLNDSVIAAEAFRLIWPGDWNLDFAPARAREVIDEARRALAIEPGSVFARTALARGYLVAGDYTEAAAAYGELVKSPHAGANYWRDYGYALFQLGRLADAERVFAHMCDKNLASAHAFYMRSFIADAAGDRRRALEMIGKALALEPRQADYLRRRDELSRAAD